MIQSLQPTSVDNEIQHWLRQSFLRGCVMPPRRRKCNTLDVVEEEKSNTKKQKTNNFIMSSDMRFEYS